MDDEQKSFDKCSKTLKKRSREMPHEVDTRQAAIE